MKIDSAGRLPVRKKTGPRSCATRFGRRQTSCRDLYARLLNLTFELIQEPNQLAAAAGLLELANRFGFDLADALASDLEYVADFFQRIAVAVAQAVTQLDDLSLTIAERLEDLRYLATEHFLRGADRRALRT